MPPRKISGLNAIHRDSFGRKVSKSKMEGGYERYYGDTKQFLEALKVFNSNTVPQNFQCIGYANTKLQFCTRCRDSENKKSKDLYFVETRERTQYKTIYCYGCMGQMMKQVGLEF